MAKTTNRKDESIVITIEGLDDLDFHIFPSEISLVKSIYDGIYDDRVRASDEKKEVPK